MPTCMTSDVISMQGIEQEDTLVRVAVRECPRRNPQAQEIADDEVHVWHASLDPYAGDEDELLPLLSEDERERMRRFRFQEHQNNFLFCRSMLRMLLTSYLGTPPAELRFAYSAHGKPSLALPSATLEFNLSHSAGKVLFAFSRSRRIGVDVERVREDLNVEDIAQRFFSSAERHALMQMSPVMRYQSFFNCWTRKEAFVKAKGEGLSCPLESFDVSIDSADEHVRLTTRPDNSEAQKWHLYPLSSFPGYAAAIAVGTQYE